jgi:alpha-glucosidase
MKNWKAAAVLIPLFSISVFADTWELQSPDKQVKITIQNSPNLTYAVYFGDREILKNSAITLLMGDGSTIGANLDIVKTNQKNGDGIWRPAVGRHKQIRDNYNQLVLYFKETVNPGRELVVTFCAYNNAAAFRYEFPQQSATKELVLKEEKTEFVFASNWNAWIGKQGGFKGAQEYEFQPGKLSDPNASSYVGIPLVVQAGNDAYAAIAEANINDWAGMWLEGTGAANPDGSVTIRTKLAKFQTDWVVKRSLPAQSPWRVIMLGKRPGDLVESEVILNLNPPCAIEDTSWIKPGRMAWDHWWSGDVKVDTATIKQYIQLAADMGWEYQLIDWQWYGAYDKPEADITKVNPAVDMDEVRRFAAEKGVKLWVWLYWTDVERNDAYKKAFPLYRKWGFAGIKIDFMDRDDQWMVNWYHKIIKAAADNHLMVDFHGAYKPDGLRRTWPNYMTQEGVLGNEYNKWSDRVTPEHKTTLPFTRMLMGPMDYTPGGFLNCTKATFKTGAPAKIQGTRAGELALMVVFDSPLACLCDHPDHYRNQPGADFLKIVPTVWDDTKVLDGRIGDYIIMARQSGDRWFVGAITDGTARTVAVPLSFLPAGKFKAQIWKDAADSDVNAEHLEKENKTVDAQDELKIAMAPGGGYGVVFELLTPGK